MKQLKLFFFLFSLCLSESIYAGNSFVYLADTTKLFYASNNEIYSPDKKQLLYFQKGNIFFSGETDTRENIFLLTTSMDINSDNLELIYEKDNRQPVYSFSNNKFYLGKNKTEDFMKKNELIHVERKKKWLAFYSSGNDSLLAYFAADSLPNSTAVIVGYTLIKKFALEKQLDVKVVQQQNQLPFDDAPFSTIKPIYGNQTVNEWMWDGKVLRPRWNVDTRLAWTFDGQTAKPQYGSNIYEQYSWDGENFKPIWKTNHDEEWSWDGTQLKPVWGSDWSKEFVIENGVVKPWSGVHPEKEWKIDGQIPLPVIILVVSGIARPL